MRARRAGGAPAGRLAAFTLIEALVVIALIGIVAAVAVPSLRAPRRGVAEAAARELAGALEAGRNAAVDRGSGVALDLEAGTGEYVVVTVPPPHASVDTIRRGRLPITTGTRIVAGGSGGATVVFDALRRARGGRFRIEHGGESYEVTVDAWTSAVRVRRR